MDVVTICNTVDHEKLFEELSAVCESPINIDCLHILQDDIEIRLA